MLSHKKLQFLDEIYEVFTGKKSTEENLEDIKKALDLLNLKIQESEEVEKQQVYSGFENFPSNPAKLLREEFEKSSCYTEIYIQFAQRKRIKIESSLIQRLQDDLLLKTEEYRWLDWDRTEEALANLVNAHIGQLIPAHYASYFFKFLQRQDKLFYELFSPVIYCPSTNEVLFYLLNPKFITYHANLKEELTGYELIDLQIKANNSRLGSVF